jgi:galactokinase
LVVDTEANHSDLTEDYASVPKEMKAVADYFNENFCSEISMDDLLSEIKSLRKRVGDRAVLRAIHFLQENERVEKQTNALLNNKLDEFLSLVNESGNSSYKYLQNI